MAAASISIARFIKPTALLTAVLAFAAAAGPAQAQAALPAPVFGTGQDQTYTPGARDTRWKIVAGPTGFTPPTGDTIPYNSYLYDPAGPGCIGTQIFDGITYNCISINPDGVATANQSWIFAQEFTLGDFGISGATYDYLFNFLAAADNSLQLFVGGSIDSTTDPLNPTITGGFTIGGLVPDFDQLYSRSRVLNLGAGTYNLYAVLTDGGGTTSFLLANGTNEVPAPLPLFGAAAAFGASRRLKRRIRLARPAATAGVGQSAPERV